MTRRYLFPCALFLLVFTARCSNYSQLIEDLDQYRPPSYAVSSVPTEKKQAGTSEITEAVSEKEQILKTKARWNEALNSPKRQEIFFHPSPILLKKLAPADIDPAAAVAALHPRFSLETLETLAFLRNPGMKAGEDRARGAVDQYSQILALEDILRQYTAFTEGLMTGVGPLKGREPMRMAFPFPGVLSLKGEIVNQAIKGAMESLEIAKREAITNARKAYWSLLFIYKAEMISEETLGLYRHLEQVAAIRYEAGSTNYQDVIKVRIQRELLEVDLDTLREKQRNVESRILEILNLPPQSKVGAPENQKPLRDVPALAYLHPLAKERRQELRAMRARVGRMERLIEMAETMILPQYTLGFSFFEDEAVTQVGSVAVQRDFQTTTKASNGIGLPKMPWYGIQDAYLRETQQELNALRKDLEKEEAATTMLVREAWFRFDLAKREELLYRNSLLKLSRDALDVSTQGYETGSVSFADVIASHNTWLNIRLAAARKISDLGIARAQLERVVGTTLQNGKEATK